MPIVWRAVFWNVFPARHLPAAARLPTRILTRELMIQNGQNHHCRGTSRGRHWPASLLAGVGPHPPRLEGRVQLPGNQRWYNDGKQCLVSNSGDGTVSVYNTKTKKQISSIRIPGKKNIIEKVLYRTPRPVGILMHPNGLYAFISNLTAGRVEVIDMRNFTLVSSIKVGDMPDGLTIIN